jgi:hypothetical protein
MRYGGGGIGGPDASVCIGSGQRSRTGRASRGLAPVRHHQLASTPQQVLKRHLLGQPYGVRALVSSFSRDESSVQVLDNKR